MIAESSRPRIALFPASFDPLTNGHLDVIHRSLTIFDEVVVAVARNVSKSGTFSSEERIEILQGVLQGVERLRVETFDGLAVERAKKIGACAIIRGLRAVSDFEYEFQMVGMNRALSDEIEMVFLMAGARHQAIASKLVKEIARMGGDVSKFVSPAVEQALKTRFGLT